MGAKVKRKARKVSTAERRRRRVVFLRESLTRRVDAYAGSQGLERCDVLERAAVEYLDRVAPAAR